MTKTILLVLVTSPVDF